MGALGISGFAGKYAIIDLTTQKYEVRDFDEEVLRNFMGGYALGAKVLYDEMPAHTPWDAPESMFGFVAGIANGSGALISARYTVVSKSPVTKMWNDANSGGHFGPKLRKSGYDAVFVKGISAKPVYVLIDDGKITFHDASKLWGKTTEATEHAIIEELGDKNVGIALIGPAGERKSLMAAVMNDTHRAAARGGPGAVMGVKNFKALVCRGNAKFAPHSKEDLLAVNKDITDWGTSGPVSDNIYPAFSAWGTGFLYPGSVPSGDASVKNWGGFPHELNEDEVNAAGTPAMDEKYKVKKYACNTCSLACGAIYELKDGKYPIKETGRPEYETIAMFGSGLGTNNTELINWCNFLCNEYGYDTISFGGTVAWAIECYENGLFTKEETGGLELTWGNDDAIVALSEAICKGTSEFAKVLNNGARAAANHYNRGFEYVLDASGIEIPQHDPRLNPGLARTYQYDPTPGRHVKGGQGFLPPYGAMPVEVKYNFDDPDNAVRDVAGVIGCELKSIGGFCEFTGFAFPPGAMPRILSAVTGIPLDDDAARKLGLRAYTMRHAFNLREGMKREDNTIAGRIVGKPAMPDGPHKGLTIDNEKLADNFFKALDWDPKTMVPSKAALEDLGGLENVINDLYK